MFIRSPASNKIKYITMFKSALGVEEKDLPFMMSSPLSVFDLLNDNVRYENFVNPACFRFTVAVR